MYCCEFSDTSSSTDVAFSSRHPESGGDTQTSEPPLLKLPPADGMCVAFATQGPQLHAVSHTPHASEAAPVVRAARQADAVDSYDRATVILTGARAVAAHLRNGVIPEANALRTELLGIE